MYECHVTIDPHEGDIREAVEIIAANFGFKVANLVMIRNRVVTEERSNKDLFISSKSEYLPELELRMHKLISILSSIKIEIWRYKLEHIIIDMKRTEPLN